MTPAARRVSSTTLPAVSSGRGDGGSAASEAGEGGGEAGARKVGTAALVGREKDLAWARDLICHERAPAAVALWGRAGIGRTRLVREVAAACEAEGAVLPVPVVLPPPPSDEVGYIGLRHVVRALSGLTPAELMDDRAVSPVDRWALTGLRVLFSRAKLPADPQTARRAAEAALSWAMVRAAKRAGGRRVLLVLDDLDRLDGASLLALRDRLQGAPVEPVTVLVSSQHARTVVLLPGVRERMLRGLAPDEAAAMLAELAPEAQMPRVDDDVAPLTVVQIAVMGGIDGALSPSGLEEVVARRVAGLSMVERRILQALAVVGVQHIDNLGALLRHPGDLEAQTESLVEAGWVDRRGAHLLLRHRLYGTVALSVAPAGTVAALHKAAAHQLRDARQLSELRAYHAIQGAADFEAFVMLEDVARLRSARGDEDGAISALSRAVSAARVQVMLGETAAASAALGVFGRKLATALVNANRIEEAQAVLDEVLRVAEPRALTRAAVLEQLATIAEVLDRPLEAEQRRREALAIAERTDDQKLKERLREAVAGLGPDSKRAEQRPSSPPVVGARPVLIVEDDRSIREGLQSVIESEGYQAFGAGNGREALDLLRRIPRPGLILLDLMMPVMSGWEVLEALRADEEFATIPVVVVSAVSERTQVAASRVLRKPVEVGKLLGIVEELCA
ncbi:MAG: response regulator [Polyangiaceae bacterium]